MKSKHILSKIRRGLRYRYEDLFHNVEKLRRPQKKVWWSFALVNGLSGF